MAKETSPCTLVYTLNDLSAMSFDDFSIVVRSLHSFNVDSFTPRPENNAMNVRLNYQASIANIKAKMGDLNDIISVFKLSYVKENELSRLAELRSRYNFGGESTMGQPSVGPIRQQRRRAIATSPYQKAKVIQQQGWSAAFQPDEGAGPSGQV